MIAFFFYFKKRLNNLFHYFDFIYTQKHPLKHHLKQSLPQLNQSRKAVGKVFLVALMKLPQLNQPRKELVTMPLQQLAQLRKELVGMPLQQFVPLLAL